MDWIWSKNICLSYFFISNTNFFITGVFVCAWQRWRERGVFVCVCVCVCARACVERDTFIGGGDGVLEYGFEEGGGGEASWEKMRVRVVWSEKK